MVVKVEGTVVAFQNRCLHQNSPLAGGVVLDGKLICPMHFWRYGLPVGEHIGSGINLPTYPTELDDGEVWVEVPDPEPPLSMRELLLRHAREWRLGQVTPLKAVLWDMGGIFQRYFTEALVDIGAEREWPLERLPLGPTGKVPDPDYWAMTEGELDEPEYLRRILERLGGEGIDFDPINDVDWSAEKRPATWAAIGRIHESPLSQAILTNDASRWVGERWWETWESAKYFDAIIDVATLAHRKPHPEPYLEALRRTGFSAQECIFIDDMPVNCRGAEAVGMQSHWFDITQPEQSVAALLDRIGLKA